MAKPFKLNIDKVLEDVSLGKSVFKACKEQGCSADSFYKLLKSDNDIKDKYTRAREDRGDSCLDKIEEIEKKLENKEIDAQSARVIIDTEKWKACKFYPKMYGDKVEQHITGSVSIMPSVEIDGEELNFNVG